MQWMAGLLCFFSLSAYAGNCEPAGRIYPACSDQKKNFEESLSKAKQENKLLVVTMGADWCPWCVSLHKIFAQATKGQAFLFFDVALYDGRERLPVAEKILSDLKLWSKISKDLKGIPLLFVVNPKTKKAIFIDTEPLEKNTTNSKGHDENKVTQALREAKARLM